MAGCDVNTTPLHDDGDRRWSSHFFRERDDAAIAYILVDRVFVLALSMLSSGIKVALMEDCQIDIDGTVLERSGTKEL